VDDGDGEKKMATKEAKPSFTPSGMRDDSGVDSVETERDEKDDDEHGAIVRWGYALVPDEIDPENMATEHCEKEGEGEDAANWEE
jgi:hypothetical protein